MTGNGLGKADNINKGSQIASVPSHGKHDDNKLSHRTIIRKSKTHSKFNTPHPLQQTYYGSTVGLPWLAQMGKNPPASAGDVGSVPRLGRSPGEWNG